MSQTLSHARPKPMSAVVSAVVTAATLLIAFGLLALGVESFWLVFVVGLGVVLPAAVGVVEYNQDSDTRNTTTDRESETESALATLRQRYARGELSEVEFERRLEQLLEAPSSPAERTRETAHWTEEQHGVSRVSDQ